MLTVRITYKSGKVETIDMKIGDYLPALESLTKEGRLLEMKILEAK